MKARIYIFLFLAGLGLTVIASTFQDSPGYMDADYYFLGGRQIARGQSFSDPVLWNYLDDPQGLPHPANSYWMPLASLVAAGGQLMTGQDSFGAAQLGFILLSGLISPVTAGLTFALTEQRRAAIFAGLIALFPFFYAPFLATTDTFAVMMVLGGLFLILAGKLIAGEGQTTGWNQFTPLFLGLLAGLMHLARADGLIWLFCGGLGIILAFRRLEPKVHSRGQPGFLVSSLGLLALGYLLVMGPWSARNLNVFGTLLSPGGARAVWMAEYDELFSYPATTLNFERWFATGLAEIARARVNALLANLTHTLVVQGQIFLAPLALVGLWKLRRDLRVQIGLLAWGLTFLIMTFIFPFPGVRGGLFHSGAAVQTLIWAAVPVGLCHLIDLGGRYRGWNTEQAWMVFQAGVILIAAFFSGVIFFNRVIGREFMHPVWDAPRRQYENIGRWLDAQNTVETERVLINNPVGFYLAAERPAVVIPSSGVESVLDVAERYQVAFLVLEENHPAPLAELYRSTGDRSGLTFIGSVDSSHIFRIDSK